MKQVGKVEEGKLLRVPSRSRGVPVAIRIALLACVLGSITSCWRDTDKDVELFLGHVSNNDVEAWLTALPRNRQVDMYFAAHRTRPSSAIVDFWLMRGHTEVLPSIRSELGRRGAPRDVDEFVQIVDAGVHDGMLDRAAVLRLRMGPLCARVASRPPVCMGKPQNG